MREGFSILELIFVIIIVGILGTVSFTYFPKQEYLRQATVTLSENIKYARHLALNDDQIYSIPPLKDSPDNIYAKKEIFDKKPKDNAVNASSWQIWFHSKGTAKGGYTIYHADYEDSDAEKNGKPIERNIARDPATNKCITALSDSSFKPLSATDKSTFMSCNKYRSADANPFITYETTISIDCPTNSCNANEATRIYFDKMGYAYYGKKKETVDSIVITLDRRGEKAYICINKAGYIFIPTKQDLKNKTLNKETLKQICKG